MSDYSFSPPLRIPLEGYVCVWQKSKDIESCEWISFSVERSNVIVVPPKKYRLTDYDKAGTATSIKNQMATVLPYPPKELNLRWTKFTAEHYNDVAKLLSEVLQAPQVVEEEDNIRRVCFFHDGQKVAQQVYDSENKSRFLLWDGKGYEFLTEYEASDGNKYLPLEGEELEKGFIKLASMPGDFTNLNDVVQEIVEWSKKYFDCPDYFREFAAYFVVFTWIYDIGNTTPYLRFMGDTGCGKTRGLDCFGQLCYNAIQMSGAATISPVYRVLDKWGPTALMEESDLKGSDESNEMIKIINCGIERGKPVMRCDQEDYDRLRFFDPFGPKVFAARYPFKDNATEGRCLTCVMEETTRSDMPPELPPIFYEETQSFRNRLVTYRLKNYLSLPRERENILPPSLEPRIKQMGLPLTVLFKGKDDPAYQRFENFLVWYQKQLRETRASSFTGMIVATLIDLLSEGEDGEEDEEIKPISCKNVADKLKVPTTEASREIRALGFKTESDNYYILDDTGKRKRHSIRKIVCSDKVWEKACSKYLASGTPPFARPAVMEQKSSANGDDTPPQFGVTVVTGVTPDAKTPPPGQKTLESDAPVTPVTGVTPKGEGVSSQTIGDSPGGVKND